MKHKISFSRTVSISRRVLVAEDDAVTMRMVAAILEQDGYSVVPAHDGREAYKILRADADYAAAIFDVNMPHLRGIDIVRYMRTEKRLMRIPVLMMSAERDLKLWAESLAAGALFFLSKPFTTAQMQTTLRLLVGKASPSDRVPVTAG